MCQLRIRNLYKQLSFSNSLFFYLTRTLFTWFPKSLFVLIKMSNLNVYQQQKKNVFMDEVDRIVYSNGKSTKKNS